MGRLYKCDRCHKQKDDAEVEAIEFELVGHWHENPKALLCLGCTREMESQLYGEK